MNATNVKPKKEKRKGWYYRMSFEHKTALWGIIFLLPAIRIFDKKDVK